VRVGEAPSPGSVRNPSRPPDSIIQRSLRLSSRKMEQPPTFRAPDGSIYLMTAYERAIKPVIFGHPGRLRNGPQNDGGSRSPLQSQCHVARLHSNLERSARDARYASPIDADPRRKNGSSMLRPSTSEAAPHHRPHDTERRVGDVGRRLGVSLGGLGARDPPRPQQSGRANDHDLTTPIPLDILACASTGHWARRIRSDRGAAVVSWGRELTALDDGHGGGAAGASPGPYFKGWRLRMMVWRAAGGGGHGQRLPACCNGTDEATSGLAP
jgi:hypothetical protein